MQSTGRSYLLAHSVTLKAKNSAQMCVSVISSIVFWQGNCVNLGEIGMSAKRDDLQQQIIGFSG